MKHRGQLKDFKLAQLDDKQQSVLSIQTDANLKDIGRYSVILFQLERQSVQ